MKEYLAVIYNTFGIQINKMENLEKFKTLKYPLQVKAINVVIPVDVYRLEDAERAFVLINQLQHSKLATQEQIKSYLTFLKTNRLDESKLRTWVYKMIEKHPKLETQWQFQNLQDLFNFTNKENKSMWFAATISIEDNFRYFLTSKTCVTMSNHDTETNKEINSLAESFLTYLPYITLKGANVSTDSYCCYDCDGGRYDYLKSNVEHAIAMLSFELRDKINLLYDYGKRN